MESEAQPGQDVRLTIDSRIQFVAEQELAKMVALHHAKSGSLVAMDPRTGDILAMANVPTFDPNEPPKPGDSAARENLAVSAPFEPGSVYKVITLSSALETTRLRPESMINCGNGSINLFGRIIHDHSRYAALSMADVLARSSNIGAINIGLQVGDKNLYDLHPPLWVRQEDGFAASGRILRNGPAAARVAEEFHRFGGHGTRNRRHRFAIGASLHGDCERRISAQAAPAHG
jgi:cell division protein FtsI (penicillin-binding protein 3)